MSTQENIVITKKQLSIFMIFFLAILYVLPIVLMNEYYKDDVEYYIQGTFHGFDHARPLKDILFYLLGLSDNAYDIRPIPVLLAAIFSGWSAVLLSSRYSPTSFFLGGCSALFILLSPFYIEVLLFGYDSFTITFSIFLVVLCFSTKIVLLPWRSRFPISLLLIFSSIATYQLAATVVIALSLTNVMLQLLAKIDARRIILDIIFYVVLVCLTQVLYFLLITPFMTLGVYAESHTSVSFELAEFMRTIRWNCKEFSVLFISLLQTKTFLLPVFLIFISYFTLLVKTTIIAKYYKFSLLVWLFVLTSPVLLILLPMMPLLILDETVVRARVLIFFGVYIYTYLLVFLSVFKDKRVGRYALYGSIFYACVFITMVANSQKEHLKYQDMVLDGLYYDIINKIDLSQLDYIYVTGRIGHLSPIYLRNSADQPLLDNLSSSTVYGDWATVGAYQHLIRRGIQLPYLDKADARIANNRMLFECSSSENLVVKNNSYNIYVKDRLLMIDFSQCVKSTLPKKTTPMGIYW